MLDKTDQTTGNPRFRIGPMAQELALQFADDRTVGQQHLEKGIAYLRSEIEKRDHSGGTELSTLIQTEFDQFAAEIEGRFKDQTELIVAELKSVHHVINATRLMIEYYAAANGEEGVAAVVERLNGDVKTTLVSLAETQVLIDKKRAEMAAGPVEQERSESLQDHDETLAREQAGGEDIVSGDVLAAAEDDAVKQPEDHTLGMADDDGRE